MIIPSGFAQANIIFGGTGLPHGAEVTLGLERDTFAGNAAACVAAVGNALTAATTIWSSTSSRVTMTGIKVKYGPNATGESAEIATSVSGTYSASDEIPNTSYLIRKLTSTGGRQGRGRLYWPGVPLQDVDEAGFLETNLITAQNTGWGVVMSELLGDGLIPVLLRAPDSPIQLPVTVTAFSCQAQTATQRRRLRR